MVFCNMHSLFLKEKIFCQHTNLSVSFFYYIRKGNITHRCFVLYHFVTITLSCRLRAWMFVVAESLSENLNEQVFESQLYRHSQYKIWTFHQNSLSAHNHLIFIFYLQAKSASLSNVLLCMVSLYHLTKQWFALNSFVLPQSTHYTLQAEWTYGE